MSQNLALDHKNKIQGLDSLRGVLSLVVVLAHAWQTFIRPLEVGDTSTGYIFGFLARFSVFFFFCLSGYVITMSVDLNRLRSGVFSLWKYFLARVFRIAPPLLFVIAFTFLAELVLIALGAEVVESKLAVRNIYAVDPAMQTIALLTLCTYGDLTGRGLNGPLWSLTYEIQLYVIAGLVAYVLLAKRILFRLLLFLILILYVKRIGLPVSRLPVFDVQVVAFLSFVFGSIAYICRGVRRKLLLAISAIVVCAALGMLLSAPKENLLQHLDTDRDWLVFQSVMSLGFSLLILAIVRTGKFGFFHSMGEYSYTLYIGHFPLLVFIYFLMQRFRPDILNNNWSILLAVISVALTLSMAILFGRRIEQPSAQRKRLTGLMQTIQTKWFRGIQPG